MPRGGVFAGARDCRGRCLDLPRDTFQNYKDFLRKERGRASAGERETERERERKRARERVGERSRGHVIVAADCSICKRPLFSVSRTFYGKKRGRASERAGERAREREKESEKERESARESARERERGHVIVEDDCSICQESVLRRSQKFPPSQFY